MNAKDPFRTICETGLKAPSPVSHEAGQSRITLKVREI